MTRLILFDVDGTLIERGDPAHMAAVDAALRESFPDIRVSIGDVDFDGKVDRQIIRELLQADGAKTPIDARTLTRMFEVATRSYQDVWEGRLSDADLLPGVRDLVERLASDPRFALGVLTGGIHGVVDAKLTRLGLEQFFPVGSFGDEVELRDQLLPLALRRAERHYRMTFAAADVLVVGDTPNDVIAAHLGNVACLGVASGRFSEEELRHAGAEAVVPDLADTERVISLLLSIKYRQSPEKTPR